MPTDISDALSRYYAGQNAIFVGEITFDHVEQVIRELALRAQNGEDAQLIFSSPGGITTAGFMLAQFIEQEMTTDAHARIWGGCHSASTYAMLCCKTRVCHPQATIVIHHQTSQIKLEYGSDFSRKVKQWRRDNRATHQMQVDFYSRKLGISKKKAAKLLLQGSGIDAEISAKKALKMGLITKISQF